MLAQLGGFPGGLIRLCLSQRGFVVQMLGAVLGVPAGWEVREGIDPKPGVRCSAPAPLHPSVP